MSTTNENPGDKPKLTFADLVKQELARDRIEADPFGDVIEGLDCLAYQVETLQKTVLYPSIPISTQIELEALANIAAIAQHIAEDCYSIPT